MYKIIPTITIIKGPTGPLRVPVNATAVCKDNMEKNLVTFARGTEEMILGVTFYLCGIGALVFEE